MKNLNTYLLSCFFLCFFSAANADPEEFDPAATITSKGINYGEPAYQSCLNDILSIYQKDLYKYAQHPLVGSTSGPAPDAHITLLVIDFGVEADGTVDCFIVSRCDKFEGKVVGGIGRVPRIRVDRWVKGKTGWAIKESI